MAMNGGGSTYKSADGIWHAAIDIEPDRATGRRRRLTAQGKTKAVANARLRMKLDAYVRKGFTPNSPSPRLMDWLETWYHERAEANLRPNSRRSYENAIVRLNKIAGARRINSLGHRDMAAIQDGLKCYSPKTATLTWSVLKNALEAARDENLIQRNPAKMVRTVSGRRRPMKVLSPAQAAELIKAEPDPMWRLNWLLAFTTGLRQGERLGLTMDELTTLNGRRALVIDHQLQRIPDSRKADWPLGEDVTDLGNGFWLCPPKTDSGERIVVLDDVMCGALDEWLAIRKKKGVDSPMLFVTGRGTPIDRRIEYFHWDKALLRIGIVNGEDGVRLRPHSARHTADTLFANAGVPESARLALMGHSDGAMDSVYLHADTEALLEASEGATGALGLNE
ncbi:tyrosine-type recombinase/integrase [Bifidobacterium apri]|uniref:tyrosine-type recombinase/integrase n=1 Tax=Bifidobacterium apri TaxID=1769423 RepID=UPI003992214A